MQTLAKSIMHDNNYNWPLASATWVPIVLEYSNTVRCYKLLELILMREENRVCGV